MFACTKAPTFLLTDVHTAGTWSEKDRCLSTYIPKQRAEAEGAMGVSRQRTAVPGSSSLPGQQSIKTWVLDGFNKSPFLSR